MPLSRFSRIASTISSRSVASIFLLLSVLQSPARAEEISEDTVPGSTLLTSTQGRTEPVQLTNHAITIIGKEEIEESYRRDLESLEFLVPGMVVDSLSSVPNGAAISIRGVSSSDLEKTIDPAVALLVDGVFVGTHQGQNALLFDLEKIEVTRGIQSTYRGPTGIAGTINLLRTKPTGHMNTRFRIALAANNRRESDFVANFPAFANVAIKLAGHLIEGDGDYMYNHTWTQRSENEDDHAQVSLSALWQVSDTMSLQYTYDGEWDKSDTPALLNFSSADDLLCSDFTRCGYLEDLPPTETGSLNETTQNFSNNMELDGYYHTLALDFELGGFQISNISSRRMTNEIVNQDLDATSIDFYSTTKAQNRHQLSNDLRVISPANKKFQYLAGYYYQEDRYRLIQSDHFLPERMLELYTAVDPYTPFTYVLSRKKSKQESKLHALYSHFDLKVDERTTMDVGVRYSIRTMDFDHEPGILSDLVTFAPVNTQTFNDEEWDKLTGSLGFTYQVDDISILYTRFSKGHRGGGYSDQSFSAQAFHPERVEALEAGLKTGTRDGRLTFNLSAYQTKWDEKLETFVAPVTPGISQGLTARITTNLSKVDINGWEAELKARFLDNLLLRASYSHISPTYDKYSVPDIALIDTDPYAKQDLSGYHLSRAPSDTFYLSARHYWSLGPGTLGLYFAYRYTTDYQTNPLLSRAWVHNYGMTDLSFDYLWKSWTFRFFSTNLKNKRMMQNVVNYTDADLVSRDAGSTAVQSLSTSAETNLPRYTGFEMRYEFSKSSE